MAAPSQRGLAPIDGLEQWLLCGHTDTAVDLDDEVVTLAWRSRDDGVAWDGTAAPGPAGLTFAANGCLYHGVPDRAQIERVAWPREQSGVDLLLPVPEGDDGGAGFQPEEPVPGLALQAVALAADTDEHLFVLDGPTGLVHVLDLVDGHLLRTVALPWTPVDLAAMGDTVLIATADLAHPLVSMTALSLPAEVPVPADTFSGLPGGLVPRRVAAGWADRRWVRWLLVGDAAGATFAVPLGPAGAAGPIDLADATDIEIDGLGALVVAGPPEADLRRFVATVTATGEDPPLRARGYDGRGLVRTPDGRIGFWTIRGFRTALEARRRFSTSGHVDAFALDSGAYRTQWGRVFVEACVPPGARIRIGFATSDDGPTWDEPAGPSIPAGAPQLVQIRPGSGGGSSVGGVKPLVPTGLEPVVAQPRTMHRREVGPDRPWARRAPGDRFEVYEAPVQSPPGRYLWVRITLEGNTRVTPRLRAVRVELSSHDLLDRLPRLYRRDEQAASFLRRYLALADGLLGEIEARAVQRDLVLAPFGAPPELLPWLASLVGLVLDDRWSEHARRTMLAEAICLFRWRGTITGLRRMMEIYLDSDVVIVEAFRFRGTGGALANGGPEPEGTANAVVGYRFRVGGEVGEATAQPLTGTTADAYRTHAHRFTVIVPRDLDDEQLDTLAHLLDLHRPAHTLVDVCHAGRGMRIGIGLHVEVSSVVGPSAGFRPSVIGASRVGPPTVLGRPRAGVRAGGARLGQSTVVDP